MTSGTMTETMTETVGDIDEAVNLLKAEALVMYLEMEKSEAGKVLIHAIAEGGERLGRKHAAFRLLRMSSEQEAKDFTGYAKVLREAAKEIGGG